MKTKILALFGLTIFVNAFSQSNKSIETEPKDMMFVPQGAFNMKVVENNDTFNVSVKLEAFWMGNEVTNKEYKEFVYYVKYHPNEELCTFEFKSIIVKDSTGGMRDSTIRKTDCVKNSKIFSELIDSFVLEKVNKAYKNYFTDKKYDDYPVVGVSNRCAVYYCIWKTKMEIDKLKQEGKPTILDYRLPLEEEWAYVASQPQAGKAKNIEDNVLKPSKSGVPNDWGLFNFLGNVSEWTSSYSKVKWKKSDSNSEQKNLKIVRGGSWKTTPNIDERKVLDQDTKESYIGFRIVRTYSGKAKK